MYIELHVFIYIKATIEQSLIPAGISLTIDSLTTVFLIFFVSDSQFSFEQDQHLQL